MQLPVVALIVLAVLGVAILIGARRKIIVPENHVGLLYRNGKFERECPPGLHRWTDFGNRTTSLLVPLMPVIEGAVVTEAISSDKFSFRLHVTPIVRITDARGNYESTPKEGIQGVLGWSRFPLLGTALHSLVGEHLSQHSIEDIVANPSSALEGVEAKLAPYAPGAVIEQLLVTSLILPPEIRKMFTEVERSRREGLAALERARGEQAALRALANAARSLENNPGLAQLRLIQSMELAKGQKSFFLGSPSGMTEAVIPTQKNAKK